MKKLSFKKLAALILSFIMAVSLIHVTPLTKARAAEGEVPAHSKKIRDKGDGTYELELTVTGDADAETHIEGAANVLVIIDTSNSMTMYNTNYGGNSVRRGDAAEKVVYDFTQKLFAYQKKGADIQMALTTFNGSAATPQTWTKTESDITGKLSSDGTRDSRKLTYNSGTNWEAALQHVLATNNVLQSADSDRTFVIFVTDGAPSQYVGSNFNGGYANNDNQRRDCYDHSKDEAYTIQQYKTGTSEKANTTFYGIYAFGDEADFLDDLVYYSDNNADRPAAEGGVSGSTVSTPGYYTAATVADLDKAIAKIFSDIADFLGISAVSITDGTTSNVQTSSNVAYHLLNVDTNSFKYWLAFQLTDNKFTRINAGGQTIEYTVVDNSDGTCTISWADGSVTVTGAIDSYGVLKYQWTAADALYDKAPPKATFTNGAVDWNLNDVGTLLNGVTYSVTFDVYPSQETLDIIADIKNDPSSYDKLPKEVQQYIGKDGSLLTNTTTKLTYTDTREDNPQPHETTFNELDGVSNSAIQQLAVSKKWENEIDEREQPAVTLDVTRDGVKAYTVTLGPNADPDLAWKDIVYISVGIMKDGKPLEGSMGHDFTFVEQPGESGVTFHWELNTPTVHPMLINNKLTMLVKVDAKHPLPEGIDPANVFEFNNATYYIDNDVVALTATNERRSSVVLTKVVEGNGAPEDAEFPFTLNVVNSLAPKEKPTEEADPKHESDWWVWFTVGIPYEDENGEIQYEPVNGAVVSGATPEDGENGWYYGETGKDIVIKVKAGYSVRINNLPTGSSYSITEGELPAGFAFSESIVSDGSKAGRTVEGSVSETNTLYQVTFINNFEVGDITVTKKWEDMSDHFGARPESITLKLYRQIGETGEKKLVEEITLTAENASANSKDVWTWTLENQPNFDDEGNLYTYTVDEDDAALPAGYTKSIDNETLTVTNTFAVGYLEITKEFGGLPEGKVPAGLKFIVKDSKGEKVAELAYEALSDETVNPVMLPAGTYTVSEEGTDYTNYTLDTEKSTVAATVVVKNGETAIAALANFYTQDKGKLQISKTIEGLPDGAVPEGLQFVVKDADGKEVATLTYADLSDQTKNPVELPVGKYTVSEANTTYPGYVLDQTKSTVTAEAEVKKDETVKAELKNVYSKELTSVTITKVWEDADNQDGIRPTAEAYAKLLHLMKGETEVEGFTPEVTDNKDGTYTVTYSGMVKYGDDGKEIVYTVKEDAVEGYKAKDDKVTAANGEKITNVHETEKTEITITKVWEDDNNRDNIRPAAADYAKLLHLMNGTAEVKDVTPAITVNNDGSFTITYSELEKFAGGKEIVYSVKEDAVKGYEAKDGKVEAKNGEKITNVHLPETVDVFVKKFWDDNDDKAGIRPDDILISLYKNGKVIDVNSAYRTGGWTHVWEGLFKYEEGKEITYTVGEPAGYEPKGYRFVGVTGSGTEEDPYIITNTLLSPYKNDPPVVKKLTGDTPKEDIEFSFELKAIEHTPLVENGVTLAVKDMPMPEGAADGVMVIKTKAGADPAEFGWIYFYIEGTYYYTISEIREPAADGYEYDQTVYNVFYNVKQNGTEMEGERIVMVGDEIVEIAAFEFVNKYTAPIEIKVTKVWKDEQAPEKTRPKSVTVKLLADKKDTGLSVVLEEKNNWTDTFKDLPVQKDGKDIDYTVEEVKVDKYTTTITGDAKTGFVITNTCNFIPTGDEGSLTPWIATLLLSAAGMGVITVVRRRKKED